LARLGKNGSIVQIGGPKEDDVWSGPDLTERSVLVFLRFVGDRQFPDQLLQHQVLVISIEMR